jgi:hypothetical protein
MAASLMGFRKVDFVPDADMHRNGSSIYMPVLRKVDSSGDIYMLDTGDETRAKSLVNNMRIIAKKHGFDRIRIAKRDTRIYVMKEEDNDD